MYQDAVGPCLEPSRFAQRRQIAPDGQQRVLRRVLREVDFSQDPVRDRVQAASDGDGEAREGLLVTLLRANDQLGIHASPG